MTEPTYVCRDWRVDLGDLLGEIADAAQRDAVPPNLKRRFRVIWRAAVHCAERRQATRYVERGVAYARKLLIAAGLPRAARDLYPEQLKYRRVSHRVNGLWAHWMLEWFW